MWYEVAAGRAYLAEQQYGKVNGGGYLLPPIPSAQQQPGGMPGLRDHRTYRLSVLRGTAGPEALPQGAAAL